MNKYIALGNLTKDPESKQTKSGKSICTFTLAVNNPNSNTFYIDIETWNKVADNCARFLTKGRKVLIEGKLQLNTWESKTGEKRSKIFCTADIVNFLSKQESNAPENNQQEQAPQNQTESEFDEFADVPF